MLGSTPEQRAAPWDLHHELLLAQLGELAVLAADRRRKRPVDPTVLRPPWAAAAVAGRRRVAAEAMGGQGVPGDYSALIRQLGRR